MTPQTRNPSTRASFLLWFHRYTPGRTSLLGGFKVTVHSLVLGDLYSLGEVIILKVKGELNKEGSRPKRVLVRASLLRIYLEIMTFGPKTSLREAKLKIMWSATLEFLLKNFLGNKNINI